MVFLLAAAPHRQTTAAIAACYSPAGCSACYSPAVCSACYSPAHCCHPAVLAAGRRVRYCVDQGQGSARRHPLTAAVVAVAEAEAVAFLASAVEPSP